MKYSFLFILFLGITVSSCSVPQDDKATSLCDCYSVLHGIDPVEEESRMNFVADSCKTLYVNILKELEGKPEEKAKFDKAYNFCQNEK